MQLSLPFWLPDSPLHIMTKFGASKEGGYLKVTRDQTVKELSIKLSLKFKYCIDMKY